MSRSTVKSMQRKSAGSDRGAVEAVEGVEGEEGLEGLEGFEREYPLFG